MPNRIWVDVEDLFQYAALNARPSGIQRIEFELCRALALMPEARDRVGFVRHMPGQHGFRAISFTEIDALHERLTAAETVVPAHAGASPAMAAGIETPWPAITGGGGMARRIAYRLPSDLRLPLTRLLRSQREGLDAVGGLGRAAAGRLGGLRRRAAVLGAGADAADGLTVAAFAGSAAAGDVLLVLGSTWFHPFYGELVATAREHWGMRIAVLIYDIIPLLRPEWCDQNLAARFRHWALALLPQADVLLTISQASARDLRRFATGAGLALRAPPLPIPVGTGFSGPVWSQAGAGVPPPSAPRGVRLPPTGSYVLTVSTIEARKNHALLFRIWRRLLDEMPAASVPTLVFAGRVGWLVDDLMRQLHNADWLDGKIVLIADPQDGELAQLYEGCRFTVFPSFYEGWGLPVTESLGFGRPCIASSASALPEAGGTLARYFDPEDGVEAARTIRRAIEDVDGTEAWRARVAAEFRPVSWDDSARGVLRALDQDRPRATPSGLALPPAPGRASHLV